MAYSRVEQAEAYIQELEAIDRLLTTRKVENGIYYYTPNPKQYKFHCSKAKRIIYCGSNRPLHMNTSIKTLYGDIKLSDVIVGHKVFTRGLDNKVYSSTVTDIPFDGIEDCYEIILDDGRAISASEDHMFPAIIGNARETQLSIKDMMFLISKAESINLIQLTYAGYFLPVKIKELKYLGQQPLRCITIDSPTHQFVLSNNIVTLNSGKTEAGSATVVMHTTGWYPDWGEIDGVHYTIPEWNRKHTAQKILWISPQFAHLIKFVEPKIMKFLPKDAIVRKPKRTAEGAITHLEIKHVSGGVSVIDFMSQEQSLMAFEGSDYDMVVADEPLARPIFASVTRGLIDRGGIMLMLFTPISEQWIKEELCDKADGKFIELFNADIMDNLFDIKGNAILNKVYIKEFEKLLTEDEKETRLHGRWYHMSGMVFKELDRSVHLIEDYDVSKKNYPIWFVIDPHDRNPHWGIWLCMDKTEDVTVCGEMIKHGEPKEYTKQVLEFEKAKGWKVRKRIIDPNFGLKPGSVGSNVTVADQFRRSGMNNLILGNDEIEGGRMKIRTALRYDKSKPISLNNRPKLYFFKEGARESWRSLSNLQYEEWSTKKHNESKGQREDVQKRNMHIESDLRYFYNSNPRYEQVKVTDDLEKPIY